MTEENEVKKEEMEEKTEVKIDEKKEDSEKNEVKIDNNPDKFDVSDVTDKVKKNPWIAATIILALVVAFMFFKGGGITGNVISGDEAGVILTEHLNVLTGGGVDYISNEDLGSLYSVTISYQDQEIPVFITKDGEYFIQGAVPINGEVVGAPTQGDAPSQTPPPVEVTKSDKPEVELFIMTHCPYGTQAEKGMIPALELLGDKIDGSIKFVHYFMHEPEETETPIQVCIREEQSTKYLDYLKCFLEDGDSARCLEETNIDETKLNKCLEDKSEDYYASDSALSEGYGVRGSPTLVINGQIVSSGRDSASYLSAICSAFNEEPEECVEELSSASPSPGFGYEGAGSDTQAQC